MQRTGTRRRLFNGRSVEGTGIDVEDKSRKKKNTVQWWKCRGDW